LMRQLGTCAWIRSHASVIITGATGTGKSYVACALAQQACRSGHRVLYRRIPRLLEELALAHADGTYTRLLGRLAKVDVLVLDDWGLAPLREQERRDMLEIFDDRQGARSTIVTIQLPVESWHDSVADPTIADALLDRIVHVAHRIKLKGPSRRKQGSARWPPQRRTSWPRGRPDRLPALGRSPTRPSPERTRKRCGPRESEQVRDVRNRVAAIAQISHRELASRAIDHPGVRRVLERETALHGPRAHPQSPSELYL